MSLGILLAQQEPASTVIHELIEVQGPVVVSSTVAAWGHDLDRDGIVDPFLWGWGNAGTVLRGGDLKGMLQWDELHRRQYLDRPNRWVYLKLGTALLQGDRLIGASVANMSPHLWDQWNWNEVITFFDLETGESIAKKTLPKSPRTGIQRMDRIHSLQNLGDLNRDGADELFVVAGSGFSPYLPLAVLDGNSLEVMWMKFLPVVPGGWINMGDSTGLPWNDLDGDGFGDLVLFLAENDYPTVLHQKAICLSGRTGEVLWEETYPLSTEGRAHRISDVSGDGVPDFFLYSNTHTAPVEGAFLAVDGADGSILWKRSMADYDRWFSTIPPAQGGTVRHAVVPGPDLNLDGTQEVMVIVQGTANPLKLGYFSYYLDGQNGDRLLMEKVETSFAEPWFPAGINVGIHPVGDIDHDGWPEMMWENYDLADDRYSAIFTGYQTLRASDMAHEGESLALTMHLPSAGGKPYRLYLSTAFEPYGDGFHLGDWNTHLGDSLVLGASLQSLSLRGTLGAAGKATHPLRIPSGAGLAGKTLHAIAIVEDATRPDGVWCKSTVASIEILP
ncbi:MAG: hypothetical protein ACPG31_05065 [Planctomycetota bacterium]